MEQNELDLLNKVLPEGFTVEIRTGLLPLFLVLDEEGEVFLQGISTTARGTVLELMERSRRHGVIEGRIAAQHEIRVATGMEEKLRALRDELIVRTEKMNH